MSTADASSDLARRPLAIGLVLAITAYAFDNLAVAAAMPDITDDLGGVALYGAAFSAFALAGLFSLSLSGPLADRLGPYPVLSVGLSTFVGGLVLGGLAPSMPVVVLARAVQGLGGGTIGAVAYVVAGRAWDGPARAKLFALFSGAWVVPGLVAPGLAGWVSETFTWRLVFLGLIPFALAAALLALPPMRRMGPAAATDQTVSVADIKRLAGLGARVTVGTALALGGLQATRPLVALPLVAVGAAVTVPPLLQLLPRGTFRALPVLPALVAVRGMLNWSFFGTEAFVPFALTEARGRTTTYAGLILTASALAWASFAWLQARSVETAPRRHMIRGMVLIAIGTTGVAVVAAVPAVPVGFVFLAWATAGAGMGLAFNVTSVVALAGAPAGQEGRTTSSLQLADTLSSALSTGLGGTVIATGARSGWDPGTTAVVVFAMTGAAVVPGILAARRLPSRRESRGPIGVAS